MTSLDDLDFSLLTQDNDSWNSGYYNPVLDGYLGIAPYSRNSSTPSLGNFMYQLEHIQDYIDNSVVMVNIDLSPGYNSVVKFGGYDDHALRNDLLIFNTA